ncbi:hypothetical protein C8R44DRAFT_729663 [Mycena epipterygia]|nr:hypothetical protein C8R44DRAFT_729663 [Mycena epipterygia]
MRGAGGTLKGGQVLGAMRGDKGKCTTWKHLRRAARLRSGNKWRTIEGAYGERGATVTVTVETSNLECAIADICSNHPMKADNREKKILAVASLSNGHDHGGARCLKKRQQTCHGPRGVAPLQEMVVKYFQGCRKDRGWLKEWGITVLLAGNRTDRGLLDKVAYKEDIGKNRGCDRRRRSSEIRCRPRRSVDRVQPRFQQINNQQSNEETWRKPCPCKAVGGRSMPNGVDLGLWEDGCDEGQENSAARERGEAAGEQRSPVEGQRAMHGPTRCACGRRRDAPAWCAHVARCAARKSPDRGMASNRESSKWPNGINPGLTWINPGLPKGHSELNRSGLLPDVPSNSTLHRSRDVGEMGGEGWWLSCNKNPNRPGLACIKPAESDPTMVLCKGLLEAWVQPDNHHRGCRRLSPY